MTETEYVSGAVKKHEGKRVLETAPICLQCDKACDGNRCLWVRYLKREYLPEGAKVRTNPKTGNIHILECPDMVPDRERVIKCKMPDHEKSVNYFRKKLAALQDKEQMYDHWRMYLQHMA